MADCNCNLELNKQIQGIMARLSQAENNITSHYYGISMAIQGLLANDLTAGSVAALAPIYNLLPEGFTALQNLILNVNPADFKKLMMTMASSMLGAMEGELEGLVDSFFTDLEGMISNVESMITNTEDQIADAVNNLNDAIISGEQAAIDAAQAIVDGLNGKLDALNNMKGGLLDALDGGVNFLTAQLNIARCKSFSLGLE